MFVVRNGQGPVPLREVFDVSTQQRRSPVGSVSGRTPSTPCHGRVGQDAPLTREGDRRCKLPPHRRALVAPVYLRRHHTLARSTTDDPDLVLLDGTLAECDRVGDGRAGYSAKHKRHGVNLQVVTYPVDKTQWLTPALRGRTRDPTAARTHKIFRICARQGVPILADMAYLGGGDWVTAPSAARPKAHSPTLSGPRTEPCPQPEHLSNEAPTS